MMIKAAKYFVILFVLLIGNQVFSQKIFVTKESVWKYLDNGSDQGTAWRELDFNDSTWSSGNAQLGYGDGDETTVVSYGTSSSNKYITTYFRHSFSLEDTSNIFLLITCRYVC